MTEYYAPLESIERAATYVVMRAFKNELADFLKPGSSKASPTLFWKPEWHERIVFDLQGDRLLPQAFIYSGENAFFKDGDQERPTSNFLRPGHPYVLYPEDTPKRQLIEATIEEIWEKHYHKILKLMNRHGIPIASFKDIEESDPRFQLLWDGKANFWKGVTTQVKEWYTTKEGKTYIEIHQAVKVEVSSLTSCIAPYTVLRLINHTFPRQRSLNRVLRPKFERLLSEALKGPVFDYGAIGYLQRKLRIIDRQPLVEGRAIEVAEEILRETEREREALVKGVEEALQRWKKIKSRRE